jgi:hypothetical protein
VVIRQLADVVVGSAAAIRTPRWIHGTRLQALMSGGEERPRAIRDSGLAVGMSRFTLRLLGRLPFLPWRNTCLYRSVAECLVLRRYGVACRVQLGIERDSAAPDSIKAHAWVERDDQRSGTISHALLRPTS